MPTDNALTASSASLGLQLVAITTAIFCPIWWAMTLALLIYKGTFLPFPPLSFGFEIACTFLLWFVHIGAVSQTKRGNLTENTTNLALAVLLLLISIVGAVYYMILQTYVMMLDLGFSATLLCLDVFAVAGCGMTIQSISSNASQAIAAATLQAQPPGHQKSE